MSSLKFLFTFFCSWPSISEIHIFISLDFFFCFAGAYSPVAFSKKACVRHILWKYIHIHWGFPGSNHGKEPACQCKRRKRHGSDSWIAKIPWRRAWQPTSVFLPGIFHKQRSLADYSPWGRKESDTTERLHFTFTSPYIGLLPELSQRFNPNI